MKQFRGKKKKTKKYTANEGTRQKPNLQDQRNEEEIGKPPGKKNVMTVKMLKISKIKWRKWKNQLTQLTSIQKENKQTMMNNTFIEIENSLEGTNNRIIQATNGQMS